MYILSNGKSRLSGFYPNQINKLAYRKNDYIVFSSLKEANKQLLFIRQFYNGKSLKIKKI